MPKKIEGIDITAKNILYNKCKLSKINTKTVDSPFFIPHNEITTTKDILEKAQQIDPHKGLTPLLNIINLEPILTHMYHLLDSYEREFTFESFTFFSLNEVEHRLKIYRKNKQNTIFNKEWRKLNHQLKLNRVYRYLKIRKNELEWSEEQYEEHKELLRDELNLNGLRSDIDYNIEEGEISNCWLIDVNPEDNEEN